MSDKSATREIIQQVFTEVYAQLNDGKVLDPLEDDRVLLESGLDSLGFAIVVTRLEERLGYDPFTMSEEAYYPQTFIDFVTFYEKFG